MTVSAGQAEIDALTATIEAGDFPETIADFIRDCAARSGDDIAADFFEAGTRLSYNDLHRRSNRIAANLQALGLRKGAHIAVMLPNSPGFLLIWFAIAKIGAVMVPVNTAYGGNELDYLLNQSDAETLIIHHDYLPALKAMTARPEALSDAHIHVVDAAGRLASSIDERITGQR